ncbi:MAG: 1-acyl-sn-glycerol-3-phosphate acyltransferase, partial [Bacteroidota bacterium]
MIEKARGALRLLLFILGVLLYIFRYLLKGLFVGLSVERGMRLRQEYLGFALRLLGVRIEVQGTPPTGGGLLVANHRSYLDPIIVLSQLL